MYIPTVCMLMRSRHSVTRFGGIGVMALTAGDGTMAGDGIVLTTLGDILRVIGAAATGVAGMAAVAIGDIITIGTAVLAGAGVVEAIGHATLIRVAVHMLLVDIVLLLLVVQIMVVRKYVGLLAYLLEVVSQRGE